MTDMHSQDIGQNVGFVNRWPSTCIACMALVLAGCGTNYHPKEPVGPLSPSLQLTEDSRADALSYGMVTGRVKQNETTQQELLEMFGGPSTMTTDRDGTEVWMYDRTTTTTVGSYATTDTQSSKRDAAFMAGFFGLSIPAGAAGGGAASRDQTASGRQGTTSSSKSIKTITFIVRFNADKTVKDYSVRQASY